MFKCTGQLLKPVERPLEIAGTIVTAPLGGAMGMMGKALSWVGLGSAAARSAAPTARVLGHHPGYLQAGEALGAKVFDIPTRIWDAMSDGARWAANQKFLDRGIADGAEFIMATRRGDVRAGSYLAREIDYLLEKGYKWAADNLSLIPK